MSTEIELGVATMFRDAISQSVALELRTPADWEHYDLIKTRAKMQTKDEVDRFKTDRSDLLAAARKEIIDRAGAKTFEHPTPFGTDKFDKSAIDRQAVAKIFNDHEAALLKIKTEEAESYQSLRHEIIERESVHDRVNNAFDRATDQRTPERKR